MRRFLRRGSPFTGLVVFAFVLSCTADSGGPTEPAPGEVTVSVSAPASTLRVGERLTLSANVSGSSNGAVRWSSNAPQVASVGSDGTVEGLAVGSATVTATSVATPTRSASVSLQVVSAGEFSLAGATGVRVQAGTSQTVTLQVLRSGGHALPVRWTVEGLPVGVTASFSPAETGPGAASTALTLTATAGATPRTTEVTIRGTDTAGSNRTAALQLTLAPVGWQQATVLSGTAPLTGLAGAEDSERVFRIEVPRGATRLTVTTSGGSGDVDLYLRAHEPPSASGIDCSSEGLTTVESCVIESPAPGDWYALLLGFEAYAGVTLDAVVAVSAPGLTLGVSPSSVTLARGATTTTTVSVNRSGGFSGPVTLSAAGLPVGVTATFSPAVVPAGQGTSTLTLSASSTAAGGGTTVTLLGQAQGVPDASVALGVNVTAPGISLGLQGATASILQGATGSLSVTVGRSGGFNGPVQLAVTGMSSGLAASISPATLAANQTQATLTLTAASNAAVGTAQLTVRASGAGVTPVNATLLVTVRAGGGGSGRVASFVEYDIPEVNASIGRTAGGMKATNDGIYIGVSESNDADDDGGHGAIVKLNPGPSADWSVWNVGFQVFDWVPTKPYNEADREISLMYVATEGLERHIGMHNENNGSPSFRTPDNMRLEAYVPDRSAGARAWAVGGDRFRGPVGVWLEDRRISGDSTSGRFTFVASTEGGFNPDLALSRPDDLGLYITSGTTLYHITSSGIEASWDMLSVVPDRGGLNSFSQLLFAGDVLWIGFNDRILKLQGGVLSAFTTVQDRPAIGGFAIPSFCVAGGQVFSADGMRYPTSGGAGVSWIGDITGVSDPNVILAYNLLRARLVGSEIACLQNVTSSPIYSIQLGTKLMVIDPF